MANEQQGQVGKVVQVMGAVVDIAFSDDQELPAIYNAIHVKDEEGTVPVDVICETMQHLGDGVVRTVAMSSTDGMVRGMKAVDTGRAIAAPVGDGCLGRIFNVLGQTVDNDDTKVPASDYWPIHRPAPAFKDLPPSGMHDRKCVDMSLSNRGFFYFFFFLRELYSLLFQINNIYI